MPILECGELKANCLCAGKGHSALTILLVPLLQAALEWCIGSEAGLLMLACIEQICLTQHHIARAPGSVCRTGAETRAGARARVWCVVVVVVRHSSLVVLGNHGLGREDGSSKSKTLQIAAREACQRMSDHSTKRIDCLLPYHDIDRKKTDGRAR